MNAQTTDHVGVEVPNGLMEADGNDGTEIPFDYIGPVRYQQVYDASQFTKVPAGGGFITRISLRPDCGSVGNQISSNLQVNLSTTAKRPDELSAVFDENIGPDDTVVWNVARYVPPAGVGDCPTTFFHSEEFYLDIPFFYHPAKGNLLLDIRKASTQRKQVLPISPRLDAQNVLGDSVSRAFAFSLSTNKAEVVDTVGLVSYFEVFPTPGLTVAQGTNNVILSWHWSFQRQTFRLQWSDRVGPGEAWVDYPGKTDSAGWSYTAVVPAASLEAGKYFRLFWDTPQPLLGSVATTPVQINPVPNR